jgi:uncharacterized protein (DUF2336 family)
MATHFNRSPQTLIDDLEHLATEKSSQKRLKLLRRVTDLYLATDHQKSAAVRYMFNEVVVYLLEHIDNSDLAKAAEDLATLPHIPSTLAHQLATNADHNIARPIVENYRALSDETLLTVANTGSQDHLRSIASRPTIAPSISDIVAERGDPETLRKIAANNGALFSSAGMRTMARKSETDVLLQALLVDRPDLSLEAVGILLPVVSRELAHRLHVRVAELDPITVGSHIAKWMQRRKSAMSRTTACISAIRAGDLRIDDVVMEMIRSKQLFSAATVLAASLEIDPDYAFGLLTDAKTQTILLLLRCINLTWPTVEAFFQLRAAKLAGKRNQEPPLRTDYESIDRATAQRVARFLKVRLAVTSQVDAELANAAAQA